MSELLRLFDNTKGLHVILLDPKNDKIIDASDSFINRFSLSNIKGKTLKESVGCTQNNNDICQESVFYRKEKNINHLTNCNHLNKRFFVRYFETTYENKQYDVMIFDEFQKESIDKLLLNKVENIFKHEIINLIHRLELIIEAISSENENSESILQYSAMSKKNLNTLYNTLIQYLNFKNDSENYELVGSTQISIIDTINTLLDIDIFMINEKGLNIMIIDNNLSVRINTLLEKSKVHPVLFTLLLSNLIKNAVSYCEANSDILIKFDQINGKFQLSIENVATLSEDMRQHFFTKDKPHFEGSGIGLYISKNISELLDITIFLDDVKDKVKINLLLN